MSKTREEKIDKVYEVIWPSNIWCEPYVDYPNKVVMIWDVLDWIAKKYWEYSFTIRWDGTINMGDWQRKFELRKPIEDQSEECIDFIYNLLPLKED